MFYNTSLVTITKASFILVFRITVSGTGELNTVLNREKKKSRVVMFGEYGGLHHVGPSTSVYQLGKFAFKN